MCFFLNYLNDWIYTRVPSTTRRKHKGSQSSSAIARARKLENHQGEHIGHYESNILGESFTISSQDFKSKQQEKMSLLSSEKQSQEAGDESKAAETVQIGDSNGQLRGEQPRPTEGETATEEEKQAGKLDDEPGEFRIRALDRRHLDFDKEYDLGDVGAENRTRWSGPFHFIQAADSQFGMIDSYIYNRTEPGWKEEIKLCENLVNICNQMEPKPKFMIICGDLADAWPSTEIRRQQVVDFKRIFSQLDPKIPLVCVCGNHDVGDEPTLSSIQEYRQNFGDDYFYFTLHDVLFIVINSQFYQHREFVKDYASKQDEWLESLLAKCKLFKYSIVFEHIPWFLKHSDEEDDYFNIKKEVRLKWLEKFKAAGVTKIMCGHYHRNAGGWYGDMELVVTSAIGAQCGHDTSGVRVVKVLERTIEHQYYAMQDIPQKVLLS